ncbi:hypothetical protein BDV59DRAFT_171213 [Aspergillus ambiguus]|uniref:bifunctional ATP-dependent DNA helicase/ssDNA endodeoxyribonuclease DNA2 n=1 Tax=Aspergillus ambiguus TaxID=176160 RepID=UPI003CCE2C92
MNITNQSSKSYPISSNSRSKLSAFRYTTTDEPEPIREKPSSKTQENKVHNNKENQSSWLNGVMGPRSSDAPKQESAAETAQPKPMKEGPQTPANRIPLADLIGNAEDALLRDPGPQITPEDYVIWQHVPPSSNPDTGSQTPAITGRKRRHSSSPTSSPLAGSSKSARKESFDLQSVQAALRTPQNDLAADLWNNYVGKVTDNGRRDLPQPRFANLLSSSPHTPVSARTGQDFSGLRRSNSCNAEWPSSKAKRRKVDGEKLRSGRGIFARSRSNFVESGRVDSSKINQLVETIEKSLRRTQPRASGQSSVDGSKNTLRARSNSPVENRVPNHPQSKDVEVDSNQFGPDSGGAAMETSSDYGDDDLDQGFLELVEASEDPFVDTTRPHSLTKRENIGPSANSSLGGADSYSDAPRPELKEIESKRNDASEADEFDEFDDFSDNIEDLLAACDATPSNRLRRSVPRENLVPGKPAPEVDADMLPSEAGQAFQELESPHDESSNEFDDGDLDMDAIEQSMLQAGADGSSHVGHS